MLAPPSITTVDQGVQDYIGTTYAFDGSAAKALEAEPVPLSGEGIPTS